jgi:hypothetical protein
MRVRFWRFLQTAFAPLYRCGTQTPLVWAHLNWLKAHYDAVVKEESKCRNSET